MGRLRLFRPSILLFLLLFTQIGTFSLFLIANWISLWVLQGFLPILFYRCLWIICYWIDASKLLFSGVLPYIDTKFVFFYCFLFFFVLCRSLCCLVYILICNYTVSVLVRLASHHLFPGTKICLLHTHTHTRVSKLILRWFGGLIFHLLLRF